jgi:hypothetical protein
LWSSVECLEELAALCRYLAAFGEVIVVEKPTLQKRAALASALADRIREIIKRNEPIVLRMPESDENRRLSSTLIGCGVISSP